MLAVLKREFKAYFTTPIGYIVLAIFYFFLGFFFSVFYAGGSPHIEQVISLMSSVVLFAMPILTMRLMSEDRRQKVDQVLLTAPVRPIDIVLGKFLAALSVYGIAFAPTLIFEMIIASKVDVNFLTYLYALLGVMLLGGTVIAIGMFISSLTESTVISGILSLVINILVLYMGNIAGMITVPAADNWLATAWAKVVEGISLLLEKIAFVTVFNNFSTEIFVITDVIYFLSFIAVFLFLCVRSLEKRRWS